MRRGRKSQPHLIRARQFIRDALCPDNGGDSGASYSAVYCLSPCSSEVHSAVMCARGSQQSPFSVPPYRRVLVLFKAFGRLDCCPSLCELLQAVKTYFLSYAATWRAEGALGVLGKVLRDPIRFNIRKLDCTLRVCNAGTGVSVVISGIQFSSLHGSPFRFI